MGAEAPAKPPSSSPWPASLATRASETAAADAVWETRSPAAAAPTRARFKIVMTILREVGQEGANRSRLRADGRILVVAVADDHGDQDSGNQGSDQPCGAHSTRQRFTFDCGSGPCCFDGRGGCDDWR